MAAGALLLTIALACCLWIGMYVLAFVVAFPAAWARMVDNVHDFFLRRGLLSSRVSNHLKVLEKGFVIRLAIAAALLVISMDLAVCVMRYGFGMRI